MGIAVTAVVTIDLTKKGITNRPWGDDETSAFNKIQQVIKERSESEEYCEAVRKYVVVLDMPNDESTLGTLLYCCESGRFSYETRWFVSGLA